MEWPSTLTDNDAVIAAEEASSGLRFVSPMRNMRASARGMQMGGAFSSRAPLFERHRRHRPSPVETCEDPVSKS